jgi:hypothetical protein
MFRKEISARKQTKKAASHKKSHHVTLRLCGSFESAQIFPKKSSEKKKEIRLISFHESTNSAVE